MAPLRVVSSQIPDPMGDIDGVVAETLIEPGHQGHIHGHRQLGLARSQLRREVGVEVVHLVIAALDARESVAVPLKPGVGGRSSHGHPHVAHLLDQAPGTRSELIA